MSTATAARTDIFRPSAPEFDPEQFACLGVFDTAPEAGEGRERARVAMAAREAGFNFDGPYGSMLKCGHCGAALRYVALMAHQPTKTLIFVGETCLEGRFELTAGQFAQVRAAAAAKREATRVENARNETAARVLAYLDNADDERLAELTYRGNGGLVDQNDFMSDVAEKMFRYGSMTPNQEAAVLRAVSRDAERNGREDARAVENANAADAPVGRVVVTGTVVMVKGYVNNYSYHGEMVDKMIVKHATGYKAFMTVPSAIAEVEVGDTVEVTVTLKASDDRVFAYGSRPSKARIVTA